MGAEGGVIDGADPWLGTLQSTGMSEPILLATVAGATLLAVVGGLVVMWWCRVRVESGQAAIVHSVGRPPRVVFSDVLVFPWLGHAEIVDLKAVVIELVHEGGQGLHCRDAVKAALTVRFTVRVERDAESVLKAAARVGADRVSDLDTLQRMFAGKFAEAVAAIVCQLEFQELLLDRQRLVDAILTTVGTDLCGWVLDDVALPRIDQVPIEKLDPNEMLGARAILRITEETARHRMRVAEVEAEARMAEQRAALSTAH